VLPRSPRLEFAAVGVGLEAIRPPPLDDLFRVRPRPPDTLERGVDEAGNNDLAIRGGLRLLVGAHVRVSPLDSAPERPGARSRISGGFRSRPRPLSSASAPDGNGVPGPAS